MFPQAIVSLATTLYNLGQLFLIVAISALAYQWITKRIILMIYLLTMLGCLHILGSFLIELVYQVIYEIPVERSWTYWRFGITLILVVVIRKAEIAGSDAIKNGF